MNVRDRFWKMRLVYAGELWYFGNQSERKEAFKLLERIIDQTIKEDIDVVETKSAIEA